MLGSPIAVGPKIWQNSAMKIVTRFNSSLCFEVPIKESLNVVAIYDDFYTAKWAEEVTGQIVRNIQDHHNLNKSFWKFDLLQSATLRRIAALDALEADIVIVAADPGNLLPSEILAWIGEWLPNKHAAGGILIALLRQSASAGMLHSPTEEALKKLAAAAGMNLILHMEYGTVGVLEIPDLDAGLSEYPLGRQGSAVNKAEQSLV